MVHEYSDEGALIVTLDLASHLRAGSDGEHAGHKYRLPIQTHHARCISPQVAVEEARPSFESPLRASVM